MIFTLRKDGSTRCTVWACAHLTREELAEIRLLASTTGTSGFSLRQWLNLCLSNGIDAAFAQEDAEDLP